MHRDLKPDNVMLVPDPAVPGGERTKLLDFGIAKLRESAQSTSTRAKTRTDLLMGTPGYMSPENIPLQISDGDSGLIRSGDRLGKSRDGLRTCSPGSL